MVYNTKAAIVILEGSLKKSKEEIADLRKQIEFHARQVLELEDRLKAFEERKQDLEGVIKSLVKK